MLFSEMRPFIRFADTVSYSIVRLPSMTYDARLLYITEGVGEFSIDDGPSRRLGKGSLVFFRAQTLYSIRPLPSFVAVAIDFDFTEDHKEQEAVFPPMLPHLFDKEMAHTCDPFSDALVLNRPVILENAYDLSEYLHEITAEFRKNELFFRERCGALLLCVLAEIARRGVASEGRAETFRAIVGYIQNHSPQNLSNNEIASSLGYDPCYLNRVVRFSTGLSLHQYVIKYRIDKALALLLSTDMSVDEVAQFCGFYSSAHFSNQCKKLTGHRPSFYKNNTDG